MIKLLRLLPVLLILLYFVYRSNSVKSNKPFLSHVLFTNPSKFTTRSIIRLGSSHPVLFVMNEPSVKVEAAIMMMEEEKYKDVLVVGNDIDLITGSFKHLLSAGYDAILITADDVVVNLDLLEARAKLFSKRHSICYGSFSDGGITKGMGVVISKDILQGYINQSSEVFLDYSSSIAQFSRWLLKEKKDSCVTHEHLRFYLEPFSNKAGAHPYIADGYLIGGIDRVDWLLKAISREKWVRGTSKAKKWFQFYRWNPEDLEYQFK